MAEPAPQPQTIMDNKYELIKPIGKGKFAVVYRACKPGFVFRISCVRVHFLRGSMKATEISSVLFKTCGIAMEARLACRTSSHLTATPAPQCPAKSCDASPVCRHLRSMCSLG